MKRALRSIFLLALAALAGGVASEAIYRSPSARQLLARLCGANAGTDVVAANLREVAEGEAVTGAEIEREVDLLRAQFGDEETFARALTSSGLSLGKLRAEVAAHLCARQWIEKRIAPELAITPAAAQQFFQTHAAQFEQPLRYRAAHLFLAAPDGSSPEIVAAKQSAIQGLAVRLLAGESFAQLAAESSEDEATKSRGGDLSYFAAYRVPPEFLAEMEKLQPNQMSAPFRTHLGFHIAQLSEIKAPQSLGFAKAQREITQELLNQKRAAAVAQISTELGAGRAR